MTTRPLTPRETEHVDPCGIPWYVTDPSTGMTQYVEPDAQCTARWVAWRRWRGTAPADERDEAEYAALEVARRCLNTTHWRDFSNSIGQQSEGM